MKGINSGRFPFSRVIHVSLFFPPVQQGIAASRPEEELERLTKKLVYDMNHPPSEDYFGTVASHQTNDL